MNKFSFTIQDKPYEVTINKLKNNIAEVAINGKNLTIKIERPQPVVVKPAPAPAYQPIVESKPKPLQKPVSAEGQPHSIIKVFANSGQFVKKDDVLFTMESNGKICPITADKDGIIGKINLAIGQNVPDGDTHIELKNCSNSPSKPKTVAIDSATAAPLPGTIVQILQSEGSAVKAGDVVLTMDSMKMVNNVVAEVSGTIQSILIKEGQAVMEGDPLFVIA